jgi:flagellar biosynthesis/type III secretory pathway chaperone
MSHGGVGVECLFKHSDELRNKYVLLWLWVLCLKHFDELHKYVQREGIMIQHFLRLEQVLQEENKFYDDIYALEIEKSDAILQKSVTLLQEICSRQEDILMEIESLENERITLINEIKHQYHLSSDPNISEIAALAKGDFAEKLSQRGRELKEIILKVKAKEEINHKLLADNIEFFEILIDDLKRSSSLKSGYGRDGRENSKVVNPVLFNITV